jgi:hypothetical protein
MQSSIEEYSPFSCKASSNKNGTTSVSPTAASSAFEKR